MIIENADMGIKIAKKYNLVIPKNPTPVAMRNRNIANQMIKSGKWSRRKSGKKYKTFCGQLTSKYFIDLGYDMRPFLGRKHYNNVNTTMQYNNALKNNVLIVSMEEAFYLACCGIPCLILSPGTLIIENHKYNHAAGTWPVYTEKYNDEKGPKIFQEGWFALIGEYISDPRAWGEVWKNEMVKCFVPELIIK